MIKKIFSEIKQITEQKKWHKSQITYQVLKFET